MATLAPSNDADQHVSMWPSDVTTELFPVGGKQEMGRAPMTYACLSYDFVIEAVLIGALCLFGFAGNTVSTICLSRDRSNSATPFLLVSLGVADTLFLASVFAVRVIPSIDTFGWPQPWLPRAEPYLAKYVYPTAIVAETGTIYLTILVTVNRYVSVCWPYRASELCSLRSARLHVAAVALFAVVFNLPRYFQYKIVRVPPATVDLASYAPEVGDDVTVGMWNSTPVPSRVPPSPAADAVLLRMDYNASDVDVLSVTSSHQLMASPEEMTYVETWLVHDPIYRLVYQNLLYFLVLFLFPLISLTFLNQRLIVELRRTRKKRARMRGGGGRRLGGAESVRSEEDITLMLIVVVIVFVVTQTPAAVTQTVVSWVDLGRLICPSPFFFYERLSDLLVVTNSSVNFIIYCLCSRRFRAALTKLVCRQPTTQDGSVAGNNGVSMDRRRWQAELRTIRPLDGNNSHQRIDVNSTVL